MGQALRGVKRAVNRAKCGYSPLKGIEMRFADALIDAGRTEMNELKTLEDRLKLATDRISAALSTRDTQNDGLTEAQKANTTLREQLAELRQEREGDLVEINKLIEQIRPLMEGNANA